jgi:predicted metal-dependent HD superfamily phosphohydrolase
VIDLPSAWLSTCRRVAARGDLAGAGAALLARWAEPHRRYHDVRHLTAVLERADLLAGEAGDPDACRLAAWFHDAVYDPQAGDNEERSATVAAETLDALGVTPETVAEVVRLVRLTRTHDVAYGDANGAVICDADLAVLAGGPDEYAAYVQAVREEYAHVPDPDFTAGRARVLRSLLAQEPLFRTEYGHQHWEALARNNVRAELTRLG